MDTQVGSPAPTSFSIELPRMACPTEQNVRSDRPDILGNSYPTKPGGHACLPRVRPARRVISGCPRADRWVRIRT